jgi:hypothetical protein
VVTNQMVTGWVLTIRAVAHDSTAPDAADYTSEKNHRVAKRPAEGQPVSLIAVLSQSIFLSVSPRCVSVTLPNSIQHGSLVAPQ